MYGPKSTQRGYSMRAQLLGFPTALGLLRLVSEHRPAALRRIGLVPALERVLETTDLGDLEVERPEAGDGPHQLLRKVITSAHRQADAFIDAHNPDALPITLGGDHTTSLGTVLAPSQLGAPF